MIFEEIKTPASREEDRFQSSFVSQKANDDSEKDYFCISEPEEIPSALLKKKISTVGIIENYHA